MNFFIEITSLFEFAFFQRAFLAGTVFAIIAPLIGQYMLFRGYSGISDGVSHIALVGLAIGLITGFSPILSGLIVSILLSLVLEYMRQNKFLRPETAVIILLVFSLSTVSILKQIVGFNTSLETLLFGSILTITNTNLYWLLVIAAITIFLIGYFYDAFLGIVFSESLARLSKIPVKTLNYLLMALAAATIVMGIEVIGGLLIGALMIIPVASSQQFDLNFKNTHILAVVFSVFSLWVGLFGSWFLNSPPGASIAMVSVLVFVLSWFIKIFNDW